MRKIRDPKAMSHFSDIEIDLTVLMPFPYSVLLHPPPAFFMRFGNHAKTKQQKIASSHRNNRIPCTD